MKKQLTALALLLGSLGFLNAAAPVLQKDGSLELDGWRGTPTTFSQSWHAWQPRKAPRIFRPVKSSNERVEFYLELPDAGSGGLSFALADGKFEGILDLRQGTLIRTICLQTPLPVSLYAGNKIEIDGKLHEFPVEFGKETIFDGTAKRVRIPSQTGEILFEGNFYFRIQDGRKWNGSTFGMRIGFLPHDGKVSKAELAFTIRHGKAGEFGEKLGSVSRPPYSAKQNAEWKAFEYSRNVKPGSALDFSARLDAPAGKYGPIVPDGNGHFAFRDRPGTPVRFYGPNFVGDSQRPADEVAHELAERIVPLHPVFQPAQTVLRVRRVDAHKIKLRVLGRDDAALQIVLRQAEIILHVERLGLREEGSTGVAFLLGAAPVLVIPRQLECDLPGLELRLLQAEDVGVQRAERVREALGHTGAQSVDIPGYKSHFVSSVFTATQRLIVMP